MKSLLKHRSYWPFVLCVLALGAFGFAQKAKVENRPQPKKEDNERREPKSKRWKVSWAVDEDGAKMNAKPVPAAIAKLNSYKRPKVLPKKGSPAEHYRTHRVSPIETTVWEIRGTVVNVAAEHDGDFRLIVADEKGNKICCVLPDPDLVPLRGRFSNQVDAARAVVAKKFKLSYDPKDVNVPIVLTGIGYFGKLNHDANPSPEGFQLHPVLSAKFP